MKVVELDGSKGTSAFDSLEALCAAIGAPDWHGRSYDAFVDSMVWGGINALEPPYVIRVVRVGHVPAGIADCIGLLGRLLAEADDEHLARAGHRVGVSLTVNRLHRDLN